MIREPSRAELWTIAVLGACPALAAGILTGASGHLAVEAAARAAIVWAPIAVGIYAWRRPPFQRFGVLLIATGAALFVTTLAESTGPTAYTIGRAAGWAFEPWLLYLILAFPLCRLQGRVDRGIVVAATVLVAVLYLPTLLVVDTLPVPA